MKNLIKKLIIAGFSLMLVLFSVLPLSAEGEDDQTQTIHSSFYVLTTAKNRTIDVSFNKNWFRQDAMEYSHDLAKLSLGLATSAFRPKKSLDYDTEDSADTNLNHFLSEAGFIGMRSDDYDKDPNMYTISTVMGHQRIEADDGGFELIAVGLCGQGYLDEWESNFSIGTGIEHDGFSRSSQLVYDRIFGYIASLHLSGPFKIWISGFSRAAAVSNITAKRLVDSPLFDEHTVFAYTFATPQTTRDGCEGSYTNIFNIVGTADPVPTVPFADWGYTRYGTTLYTPCIQTDSDYAQKRVKADVIYKNLTGIDYWVNPEADAMSRTILAYLQKICPTPEIYAGSIQEKLIRIWEDRSPLNILSNLLDLANDPVLINEETRTEANGLMDYLAILLLDSMNSSSSFVRWNSSASLGANALQAHTPELYISWVFSTDTGDELYTNADSYRVAYIIGTDNLSLVKDGKVIEEISLKDPLASKHTYLFITDESLTALMPMDYEYSLYMEPKESQVIEIFELKYVVGKQSSDQTVLNMFNIKEGDNLAVTYPTDGSTYYSKQEEGSEELVYRDELDISQSVITRFVRSTLSDMTWRNLTLILLSIPVVIICLIIFQLAYIIGRIRFRQKVKLGWIKKGTKYHALPFLLVTAIILLYVLMQMSMGLFPDSEEVIMWYKNAIGGITVLLGLLGWLYRKDMFTFLIMIGVLLLMGADLTMTGSLISGALFHIGAYLAFTITFIRRGKPGIRQIVLFVLLAGISVYYIMKIEGDWGIYRILAIAYVIMASMMVIASMPLQRRLFMGSILLFAGGLLLINNQINAETFISHATSLGVYYAGVTMIAASGTQTRLPRLVPAEDIEPAVAQPDPDPEAVS